MLVGNIVIGDEAYRCHMALLLDRNRKRRETLVIHVLSNHIQKFCVSKVIHTKRHVDLYHIRMLCIGVIIMAIFDKVRRRVTG
jgi:hypothetical protein